MRFKIIGPLTSTLEMDVHPAIFTASMIGYSFVSLSKPDGTHLVKNEIFELINKAFDQFVNFFYVYDLIGNTECYVGEAIESLRDKIILASKHQGEASKVNIQEFFSKHCSSLRTDYIDIYFLEYNSITPIEESMMSLKELLKARKIRSIGLSGHELNVELIKKAHAICPVTIVQINHSLWNRTSEQIKIVKLCKRLGITYLSCASENMTYLPKTVHSFKPASVEEKKALEGLNKLALQKAVTSEVIEIAWAIHQNYFLFLNPLTSDTILKTISSSKIKLLPEDITLLNTLFPTNHNHLLPERL